jgi:Zn-dependent protease with chaperone function
MRGHGLRLPVTLGIAVFAAGVATVALRPRNGLIDPAPADPQAYFSTRELDRILDYAVGQRAIGITGLAVTGLTLGIVALRPPRAVRRALRRTGARPVLGGAAAGAGISLLLVVVDLPLSAWSHSRSKDFGLSTQDWGAWLGDVAKASGIGAVFAGVGGAILVGLMRRFPRHWWAPGAAAVVAISAIFLWLSPVVIEPLFNKFERLPDGPLRSQVLDLAKRSNVDVGEVYRVDASRRTTGANAYVAGLGHTKRVVLYDNLIEDFTPAEVRSVVAHELGHVKHRDVPRGLLWILIVAPAGLFAIQRLTERIGPDGPAGPATLPAAVFALALVSFVLNIPANQLSRDVESSADAYALRLTDDPNAFAALQQRLAIKNLSDPDPPGWTVELFRTHPPTMERIGYALRYAGGGS